MTEKEPIFLILIVEDRPAWRGALERAYKRLLGPGCHVDPVDSKQAAMTALRSRSGSHSYDLLSLDVNLKHAESIRRGLSTGPYGLDLVAIAARDRLARGCLLISAALHDEELENLVVPNENADDVLTARTTIPRYGVKWFGEDHWSFIPKPRVDDNDEQAISRIVDSWLADGTLGREMLLRLSSGANQLSGPYKLIVNGEITPDGRLRNVSVVIRSTHERFRDRAPASVEGAYVEIIVALVRAAQFSTFLSDEEIVRILPGKKANTKKEKHDIAKTQIRTYLRNSCRINPDGVLRVRVGGGGLVLADDVSVVGSLARAVHPPYKVSVPRADNVDGETRNVIITTQAADSDARFPERGKLRRLRAADAEFVTRLVEAEKMSLPIPPPLALRILEPGAQTTSSDADVRVRAQEAVDAFCRRLVNHPISIDPVRLIQGDSAGWRPCAEVVSATRSGRRSKGSATGTRPDDVELLESASSEEWDQDESED